MTMNSNKYNSLKKKFNNTICDYIIDNDLNKIKELINKNNIDDIIYEEEQLTALHIAIIVNSNNIIKYLIDMGSDINKKNKKEYDSKDLAIRYNLKFFDLLHQD
jgi:ankyrin repeat protein